MRVWKRVLACALTAALVVPSISAAAEEPADESKIVSSLGSENDSENGTEDTEESTTPEKEEGNVTGGEEGKEESEESTTPEKENGSNALEDKDTAGEETKTEVDEVQFNTGNHVWSVVNQEAFELGTGDVFFEEDGSYTINLEDNAFFPYEVQFTHDGEVTNEWFMTPDDSVEVGGHTFYVSS